MQPSIADPIRRYREEAAIWQRVAAAMPDPRRSGLWRRLAEDYAARADEAERRAGAAPLAAE